ncbi:SDR family oxidoreductase [Flavisphingomonas formosensis]|uniref:SDR family oxidoreductase n=1 Tax=Flavisphingomonas formosensis TaxID=861534 RepID=UPI0012F9DE01|nr:SDR family oxidoreductase [Sphingomonas formosensis]
MSAAVPPYPRGRELLAGRTVLVTASAGSGIGFATAKRCAEEGAVVMLSDIHTRRLAEHADALEREIGRRVHRMACDVRDAGQVAALIAAALEAMGRLDVLLNNAGLGGTHAVTETSDAQWEAILDTNLGGTFRCMRAALPAMIAQGGGSIVNMGSICAWRAEAGQSAYAASKAGILAMTRCVAIEAAEHGIRINAVVPSLALHPHLRKVSSAAHLDRMIRENEAFGRAAEPWEIANAVVFLASDYASYMTGEALSVSCRRA